MLERLAFRELILQGSDKVCFCGIVPRQVGLDLLLEAAIVDVLVCPLRVEGVLYLDASAGGFFLEMDKMTNLYASSKLHGCGGEGERGKSEFI